MEDEEMRARAEKFLDKLKALNEIADGWEDEIAQGIRLLSTSIVSGFVQDASETCFNLGQIMGSVMNGATVRLPRVKKEVPAPAAGPDDPHVISFPGAPSL
jgi:hypothetical protein